jgi:hypothetical protein
VHSAPLQRPKPRRRPHQIRRITNTDELAEIFGVDTQQPPPAPAVTHDDLYDDDEDDTFLTGPAGGKSLVQSQQMVRKMKNEEDCPQQREFAAKKAAHALDLSLNNRVTTVDNTQRPYQRGTRVTDLRKEPRKNYVINQRYTNGRRGRRPRVAEVYANIEKVLDSLDNQGSGGSGLRMPIDRNDARHHNFHQQALERTRNRRKHDRETMAISSLLNTTNRTFERPPPMIGM